MDRPNRISLQWLRENKCLAVPCPESLEEDQIIRLTDLVTKKGLQPVFGACTEVSDDSLFITYTTQFLHFNPTAFFDFELVFGPWNWVIFSESRQIVVLKVELGWCVIAGVQKLVEEILGQSIKQAQDEFYQHALYYRDNYTEGFFPYLAQNLLETYEYYQVANEDILGT